jgi:hypothetical protein
MELSPDQIVRQLLSEAAVLGLFGGAANSSRGKVKEKTRRRFSERRGANSLD